MNEKKKKIYQRLFNIWVCIILGINSFNCWYLQQQINGLNNDIFNQTFIENKELRHQFYALDSQVDYHHEEHELLKKHVRHIEWLLRDKFDITLDEMYPINKKD